jgi:hypothetical protein
MEQMLPSSLRRRPSSPINIDASERGARDQQRLATLAKQLGRSSGAQSFGMLFSLMQVSLIKALLC